MHNTGFNKPERKIVIQALRNIIKEMTDAQKYEHENHEIAITEARSALWKLMIEQKG